MAALLLLALLAMAGHASPQPHAGCSVDVNKSKMPYPQPLLLKPGGSKDVHGFVMPDSSGVISLSQNQKIIVACPDSTLVVTKQPLATATCFSGTTFTIGSRPYSFSDLRCVSQPKPSERNPATPCGNSSQYQVIELGFKVGPDFYTLIDACFDTHSYSTVYDHFTMVREIRGSQTGFPRPDWLSGKFFPNVDMDCQYKRIMQIDTVGRLLGDPNLGSKYISRNTDYYLSKGHLTAKSDFSLGAQEYVTFFYMNAAPQWQTFNGGNWNIMEGNVRSFAATNRVELQIYTGTHGITTLPNVRNESTELYLYTNGRNYYIPVPKLFWKIVYREDTKAAVVFLGVNNPYIEKRDFICKDVCTNISWVTWKDNDQKMGYSYCCEYDHFKRVVADAPNLDVTSLLT